MARSRQTALFRTAEEAMTFFAGEWSFCRSLSYRLGGGVGSVAGRASWIPWPHPVLPGTTSAVDGVPLPAQELLLLYDESGELQLQGVAQPFHVSKQYAFNCAKLPLEIYFVGGELGSGGGRPAAEGETPRISYLFHPLNFVRSSASGDNQTVAMKASFSHPCVDDLYEGTMVVISSNEFEWSWRVTGPDKDGTIHTRYVRDDAMQPEAEVEAEVEVEAEAEGELEPEEPEAVAAAAAGNTAVRLGTAEAGGADIPTVLAGGAGARAAAPVVPVEHTAYSWCSRGPAVPAGHTPYSWTHGDAAGPALEQTADEVAAALAASISAGSGSAEDARAFPSFAAAVITAETKAGKEAAERKAAAPAMADNGGGKKGAAPKNDPSQSLFSRLDMRVGEILSCEPHPESADYLWILQIDVGDENAEGGCLPRQILTGMKDFYPTEDDIMYEDGPAAEGSGRHRRKVLTVLNLRPRSMGGVRSHGMICCAGYYKAEDVPADLAPFASRASGEYWRAVRIPRGAKPGAFVRCETEVRATPSVYSPPSRFGPPQNVLGVQL
jgi:tRNA-binding EMAP/Myf-like protein